MSKSKFSFAQRLDRLAQVAVQVGLRPTPGQKIIISFPTEALPLVRRIAEHAHRAGAAIITPLLDDTELNRMRYQFGKDDTFDIAADWMYHGMEKAFSEGTARMAISGASPNALDGLDSAKIARAAKATAMVSKPVTKMITSSAINWNITPCATVGWAKMMFPELSEKQAMNKLWDAIFAATRVDCQDPVAAWEEHNNGLLARRKQLNEKNYAALNFRGPGTDLEVGLADGHVWAGGVSKTPGGLLFNPNMPTEEVFSAPHRSRVRGYVTSTKPLALQGKVIKGIFCKFEDGRIVHAAADQGLDVLEKQLSVDEGSSYLGEVALVPHSSPISASGLLFYNTLFDENAACHIAIGQSYSKCVANSHSMSQEELRARGCNESNIHTDWMIGSGEVDVDGITANGTREPLMRKGEWVSKV